MDPGWFSGFFAVLVVMTFATTTNHMLFVTNALKGVDFQTIEAARNMGASTWTILRRIVLPMLKPTLFAVTVLSFLTGLGALSAPQVLGGRDFQTITPMILTFTNSPTSRDLAALLAVILGVATILMLAVMTRLEKGGTYFSVSKVSSGAAEAADHQSGGQRRRARHRVPAVRRVHPARGADRAVFLRRRRRDPDRTALPGQPDPGQLRPGAHPALGPAAFHHQRRLQRRWPRSSPSAACCSWPGSCRSTATGSTPLFEYLLHIPWILPSALLALGLIISYDHPNPLVGGAVLTGTTVILLIAFVTVKIPFTLRMLKASFASVNSSLEEAAAIMGAKTLYVFRRILLPLVLPSAAAITALNFNSMLDDYDTAIFLAHPLVQPLGLVIKANTDGAEGVEGVSNTFVYTVLLMVITGVTMYLVYGRSGRRGRSRRRKRRVPFAAPGTAVSPVVEVQDAKASAPSPVP